jgi:peptide/nickel transport system permease protein
MSSKFRKFLLKRLLHAVIVLWGLSVLVFTLSRVLPGDPVRLALGARATPDQVERLEEQMGLNDPIPVQYVDWFTGLFRGEWGESLRVGGDVFDDITGNIMASLELGFVAMLFALLMAIPLGILAGTHQNTWIDHLSRFAALFGVSMPRFWVALMLQLVFVVGLGLFPLTGRLPTNMDPPTTITGFYLIDSLLTNEWELFKKSARHIFLPALALSIGTIANVMRLIRSDMLEERNKDYILAAEVQGLPRNLIVNKYMFKNAFTNSLTIIGLSFATLLGSQFLVEIIFSWPGLARYGALAVIFRDFNAIVGVVMVIGILIVFVNLIVDILYGYLDPRVYHGED